ncbi:aminotransferase class I/II-fold pyridoxal phosphate-dependent enzyme [Rhizobiales bacterium L72]|uniref:aspartate transaminase n=2 Tax=Propylenella binzhouense TaxID=2555902 RepID=A0A964WV03_9HYPH|nr:aminotransferase class I/II-fold pyridoxal phosphate-dependent enzyme [Propylenella binzhouense]
MDVLSAAAEIEAAGRSVVHMEVGQPGAPAPGAVLEAARRTLEDGRLGYTEALGIRPLRERIARHYRDEYGRDVPASRVMVTTGSSGGFTLIFLGAFDPGARIAMAAPGYPAYRNILIALGLVPVEIPVGPRTRWVLTAEDVERAHAEAPLDGVLVASPANPTGTLTLPEALGELVSTCARLGIRFISDEIYHGLVYEGRAETALAFGDEPIVVNSFSKYYCMTGWRVGWLVLPEDLVRPFERLAQSFFISVPELSQRAAIAAFDARTELEAVKAGYARNRAHLLERLPALGFDEIVPVDGAFYVYASVARFTNDALDFSRRMLNEAGVAATPGPDFDRERGHRYVRFSFAGTEEAIREGVDRLAGWLR